MSGLINVLQEFVGPNFLVTHKNENLHSPPFIANKLVSPLPHTLGLGGGRVSMCNEYGIGFELVLP